MKPFQSLVCGAVAALCMGAAALAAAPAPAGFKPLVAGYAAQPKPSDEQSEARREMRAGKAKSLREIERMILPKMAGAEYLGPAYDSVAHAYRLKFIRNGRVLYVDVDARTGKIINQSG